VLKSLTVKMLFAMRNEELTTRMTLHLSEESTLPALLAVCMLKIIFKKRGIKRISLYERIGRATEQLHCGRLIQTCNNCMELS